jgi:enoyl-[acyl-carrier-protein] reductase (NADH)
MLNDLKGKAVLITGGTRGIGLATGLAFGRLGAACILTNKWGSADEAAIAADFAQVGAPAPSIVQADASRDQDTRRVVESLLGEHARIEVLVSNVAFGQMTPEPRNYSRRGLLSSVEYSAWPLVCYIETIREVFGTPPRYAVGLSSDGPDRYIPNYDLMAGAKAVLETLAKYLAHHYRDQDARINVVRAGMVHTESLEATLGASNVATLKTQAPQAFMAAEDVAKVIVALCSGLMDAVTGQTLCADYGRSFSAREISSANREIG